MKTLNLTKILKGCPKGMTLYSPTFGEVTFVGIGHNETYPIETRDCDKEPASFTREGKYYDRKDAECMLFPSKECRDWSRVQAEHQKIAKALNSVVVDEIKKTLFVPFQKVLVRDSDSEAWRAQFYSHYIKNSEDFYHQCVDGRYRQCIPYEGNEALLGTNLNPNIKAE